MHIDVIPVVNEARTENFINKTAIVIDTLRATSTITTALYYGSSGIVPVETVCQATGKQEEGDLLGGERNCKLIAGFDMGNSPFEYMTEQIQGKRIIMTTTNGTRAISKALRGDHVLAGCLLNANAVSKYALSLKRDITIICAGTRDEFALEDGLTAGCIVHQMTLLSETAIEMNDFAIAMMNSYLHRSENIEQSFHACSNGIRLSRLGMTEDVQYCAQRDIIPIVPVLRGDTLIRGF